MNKINFTITIVNRNKQNEFIDFFQNHNVPIVYSSPCRGTAKKSSLDYLGLEDIEKIAIFSISHISVTKELLRDLIVDYHIDAPGRGISFVISIDSLTSYTLSTIMTPLHKTATTALCNDLNHLNMGDPMKESKFHLIIAIANNGFTDFVMNAAREAGAVGGTVLHTKGTANPMNHENKFFGLSIASEKEMILIVTKHEDRNNIMKSIQDKAGANTQAAAIVFSMPVESVEGINFNPNNH